MYIYIYIYIYIYLFTYIYVYIYICLHLYMVHLHLKLTQLVQDTETTLGREEAVQVFARLLVNTHNLSKINNQYVYPLKIKSCIQSIYVQVWILLEIAAQSVPQ